MLIIGTGLNGRTILSVTSYFARNGSLFLRFLIAAKSLGESEGTDVTTPVPI